MESNGKIKSNDTKFALPDTDLTLTRAFLEYSTEYCTSTVLEDFRRIYHAIGKDTCAVLYVNQVSVHIILRRTVLYTLTNKNEKDSMPVVLDLNKCFLLNQ